MPRASIIRSSKVTRSPRVMQLEGIFEISPSEKNDVTWEVDLPLEEKPWNIGLIVGPSGCGKSTIAKELFGQQLVAGYQWSTDKTLIDDFPKNMSIKEITKVLSSVGFSSVPNWLRPFHVLSNGEQFRVTMARAICEEKELFVVDEFTSVIDRTVAQIGSCAISKTIRNMNKQFVAVACHYDIIEWLQPDWIFQPATNEFTWRSLRRRPDINIKIIKVHKDAWQLFKQYHYLDTSISPSAQCYMGFIDNKPVAFASVLPFPHAVRPGYRGHRTVCLPDYQGVGIGNALSEYVASLYKAKKPYFSRTGNPAMIHYRAKSKLWKMTGKATSVRGKNEGSLKAANKTHALNRMTAGFEYIGQANPIDAKGFGIIS